MRIRRWVPGGLAAACWLAVLPAAAQTAMQPPPDPESGRVLAGQLCSACHLVSPQHKGPVPDSVPPFMALAERLPQDPGDAAARLLGDPHPQMPEPPLTQAQLLDVAAYILSLKGTR
ncbi:hypothetical protein SH611_02255 [Geminicoccaceae bacterium 1502E]|nr:hypothetical protein [Geminicoccaceae bacterium 1502E]